MSSSANREGVHYEQQETGYQNITSFLCAAFSRSIEGSSVRRRVSKGGDGGGLSLSLSLSLSLPLSLRGQVVASVLPLPEPVLRGTSMSHIRLYRPVLQSSNEQGKERAIPDRSSLTGFGRHPPFVRKAFILSASTKNGAVSTARAACGACSLRSRRRMLVRYMGGAIERRGHSVG